MIGTLINDTWKYFHQGDNDVILENIQKLRVFNRTAELFVWRTKLGKYKGRLKIDETGSEQEVVDAWQVLFGTEAEMLDKTYSKLKEKRGTEIILPLNDLGIDKNEINDHTGRLCIHTRSYIGTIEATGQATFEDVRFVEFGKYQEEVK